MAAETASWRPAGEAEEIFAQVSNWQRWGPDDELGTLNLITPAVRAQALSSVRDGVTIGCGVLELSRSAANPAPAQHFMTLAPDTQTEPYGITRDHLSFAPHGPGITHIDALCHVFYRGLMYNGRPAALVTSAGAAANAISALRDGIVTRGVLFDIPALRGTNFVDPGDPVTQAELTAAEQRFGAVRAGDALLVRVGRLARREQLGIEAEYIEGSRHLRLAGLDVDCLPWLRERGVALMLSDAGHDALPSPFGPAVSPIHVGCLVFMGLYLVDNARLDRLARECGQRGRWSFLLTVNPLDIDRCTGSPVNPVAVL